MHARVSATHTYVHYQVSSHEGARVYVDRSIGYSGNAMHYRDLPKVRIRRRSLVDVWHNACRLVSAH
jgi:hypothetical protein